ncbi:hypothetical protein EIN_084020 [Entamoeba invadens IP1]|uniref:hypothetical protein n=1 Tax=Entamoeba invadens IP1 TaxID=370355 RepID=UPI0002C3F09E|nr:hypothetical protein EIN_084020 [Entamoeba invadens IP1]ELP85250.1 hypothetical protein EIN_084020 [Entamoeba invadens IP1]|eukprot:XP_004184596.1 hypothetical protein EIN_084020 [Entamoeba invadens IP1]
MTKCQTALCRNMTYKRLLCMHEHINNLGSNNFEEISEMVDSFFRDGFLRKRVETKSQSPAESAMQFCDMQNDKNYTENDWEELLEEKDDFTDKQQANYEPQPNVIEVETDTSPMDGNNESSKEVELKLPKIVRFDEHVQKVVDSFQCKIYNTNDLAEALLRENM